ncbi:hypothetical protein Q7S_23206 (plasmid) [Rahnella aquatilis HX2]|nr:hypothetical protein Q7S_23206 [Rahnella aquatilis HX2]
MHIEFLIEDISGKRFLEIILPKIISNETTYKIHSYKGIGKIPQGLNERNDPRKRILLSCLPGLLKGYGKAFNNYPADYQACVVVVCDSDRKDKAEFVAELEELTEQVNPRPDAFYCIAVEENEAWFLGDIRAIKTAYPKAKDAILQNYVNDSVCGTWEVLANAVYPGGAERLKKGGWMASGKEKSVWSDTITPHMDVTQNNSPSFCEFRETIQAISS